MHLLQQDVTAEEANALEAITVEWDKKKESYKRPQQGFKFVRFIAAFAVVAAVLVFGVVSVWIAMEQSAEPKSATEVVQLLLEQNRPFEARMSGQPHRPIVRTRAAEDADVSYGLLAGEMTRLSATSYEMGRFYLLQKDFSRAIPYLEIAEREVGASPAVHNDLGVAYLESENASQLVKAEPEFLHALQHDKSFATAVFNLALFYERSNATRQAEAQWKRYLERDSKSDWATEARGRLQGLSR
jgi:tetratricopeptide (TPR) repeat protein